MKKILIVIMIIFLTIVTINTKSNTTNTELIRIRVLANSNDKYDQNIKNIVSTNVKNNMYNLLKDIEDIDVARSIIKSNLISIENIVKKDLDNVSYSYKLNYGLNYFPQKTYNDITYNEGLYESLLITLGEGKGNNWWCILFPPICLIEVEESNKDIEYDFYFNKLLDKIFH